MVGKGGGGVVHGVVIYTLGYAFGMTRTKEYLRDWRVY